ncbi:MAG: hypothetical protein CM1200mP10_23560 [Candidatus Neomarinimicrobiota bacterium]|nr:MAG: hypothetical protein CM1200mP10_23560 [Candidatus Neomarinimicrobiota bacterium]
MSILVVFWPDIHRLLGGINDPQLEIYLQLVLGAKPAIIVGLSLKDQVALMFDNHICGLALIITGKFLFFKMVFEQEIGFDFVKGF